MGGGWPGPGLVVAQPLTPRVIQAKLFILSLHVLNGKAEHPNPDASKVSEGKSLFFNSWIQIFFANLGALGASPSQESMPLTLPISEHTDGCLCFSTHPHTHSSLGLQEDAKQEHSVRKQELSGSGAPPMPALRGRHLPNLSPTQETGPGH